MGVKGGEGDGVLVGPTEGHTGETPHVDLDTLYSIQKSPSERTRQLEWYGVYKLIV